MNAEHYRPTTWDEIVGQPTDEIQAQIDGRQTPDMLFYGPPGTGKTTAAYRVCRDVQGGVSELMEFNTSDERGIDVVRDEIIPATRQGTLSGAPRVIFLDEMDNMTMDAQQALRRPMEQSGAIFVLACNRIQKVHEAVRSRCYEWHFEPLDDDAVAERVRQIADDEGIDLTPDRVDTIASFASGDMRAAIQQTLVESSGGGTDDKIQSAAANFRT